MMKYRWALWILLAGGLTVGLWGGANHAVAQDSDRIEVSKIVSIQGRVVVNRHGQTHWMPIKLNDPLNAGDRIRVEANSRAGILLKNDTVLRLDQNTTLVFTEIKKETTFFLKLLQGAANFFSRRPRSLNISTPFVNGVVEGTEFSVRVNDRQTSIDLFEGRILAENRHGKILLNKGDGAVAAAGSAPRRRLISKMRDSVNWALYYPPVLALGTDPLPDEYRTALSAFHQGRILEAIDQLRQVDVGARDSRFYVYRAVMTLHVGRVFPARSDIRQALALDPDNGEALALKAIVAVVQGRKKEAIKSATEAIQRNPSSAAAHIALSYVHQARFDIPNALEAARSAAAHAPESGTAWARLAELQLSTGRLESALTSARKSTRHNPHLAHSHTIMGFAHLIRIETALAQEAFETAISLDSAAPLARLGLGMAKIRDGELLRGRSDIEIAAGLDPGNALIRSYLGKAYFDEKREPLDGKQLDIAKTLDPEDPTPWYYDAIRKQSLNRPAEALRDLEKSIGLNDNRAVYRSRLLLDDDLAARSASLGRIYGDLGFEQLALSEGWSSVNLRHGDHSGHRLLADSYSSLPRHDIAQASELLQSKLLQPLNLTPLQAQLGETNLLIPQGVGPGKASFNEFNPLFTRDGLRLDASAVAGSNTTWGNETTLSGVADRFSFSAGQLYYRTDGFRANNDLSYNIYNVFAQFSPTPVSSVQVEMRSREDERGDLRLLFDPQFFAPNRRLKEKQEITRIGGKLGFNAHDSLLISLIQTDLDQQATDRTIAFSPFEITTETNNGFDLESTSGELQYLHQANPFAVIAGVGYIDQDRNDNFQLVTTTTIAPLPPRSNTIQVTGGNGAHHANAYAYTHLTFIKDVTVTIGAAYDSFQSQVLEEEKLSPKVGLMWSPLSSLTVRGAWFRNISRPLISGQTVEPTQVAGFNQFFDDIDGSETERFGVAADARLSNRVYGGVELSWRNVDSPRFDTTLKQTTIEDQKEQFHRTYINWIPCDFLAVSGEAFFETFDINQIATDTPLKLTTQRYPIGVRFQFPMGLYARTMGTYVDQELEIKGPRQRDSFWVVDASVGYRFPKRVGLISLGVKNLFDETFSFQDYNVNTDEPLMPVYIPDRMVFGQMTLAF